MWQAALCTVLGRGQSAAVDGARSPGNVDVQYRGRASGVHRPRRIAAYISKYITKELIERFNKKRYWHTKGVRVPEAQRLWLESDKLDEAVIEVMRRYGLMVDGCFQGSRIWKPGNLAFFWIEAHQLEPPPF
jgi:hypothetical protein